MIERLKLHSLGPLLSFGGIACDWNRLFVYFLVMINHLTLHLTPWRVNLWVWVTRIGENSRKNEGVVAQFG